MPQFDNHQSTAPQGTPKNRSSPGRGGKTFEKHDVFRERAMDGESAFYHPVLENFGSSTVLARRWIMTQHEIQRLNRDFVGLQPNLLRPSNNCLHYFDRTTSIGKDLPILSLSSLRVVHF